MEQKYWHKTSNEERQRIIDEKRDMRYINEIYVKPIWCTHFNPLFPSPFGCGDLLYEPKKISINYCKKCKFYKNENYYE